jgi:autophagy-related protein 11
MRQIEADSDLNQLVDVGSETAQRHPIKDTREALEKLVTKMDNLEADFDKIAEKSSAFT